MAGVPGIPSGFDKPYMALLSSLFKLCIFVVPGFLWVSLYGAELFGERNSQTYVIAPLFFSAVFMACGVMGYHLAISLNQKTLEFFLLREYWRKLEEIDQIQYGTLREPRYPPAWSEEEYQQLRQQASKFYWWEWEAAFEGTATTVPRLGSIIGSGLSAILWLSLLYLKSQNLFHLPMGWATFICVSLVFFAAMLVATLVQIPRVRTLPRKLSVVGVFVLLCLAFYFVITNFVNIFA